MAKGDVKFTEIGRVTVSPTTDVVVSSVERPDEGIVGISVNTFITSGHYTGPTKGTFIPNAKISEFTKLINSLVGG